MSASLTPRVGGPAPAIDALTATGETFRLADAAGQKWTVVFFYPMANTPG